MAKTKTPAVEKSATRTRRGEDERIAELEAKIAAIKRKAAAKKVQKEPSLRHITAALRSIEKAMVATSDAATKGALDEARATLSACLSLNGVAPTKGTLIPQPRRSVSADALFEHVRKNPGQRGEQIAAALGTDTSALRRTMKELVESGKVKTAGQRRGMSYAAA